jgi:hypothetical protein
LTQNVCTSSGFILKLGEVKHGYDLRIVTAGVMNNVREQLKSRDFFMEIGTSSIDWAQLRRVYLKTETKSSLQNVVF